MTLIGLVTAIIALQYGLWNAVVLYVGLAMVLVGALVVINRPIALLFAISALTFGPLCGPVWLLVIGSWRWSAQPTPEPALDAPTRAERIIQDIRQGRRPVIRDRITPPLIEVFASGSLAEQQSALAAIARYFTPELRPALNRAQASDIPAIRAQSTAILTQLRDAYTSRARKVLANKTSLNASALAAEIEAISRSGFVDLQTVSDLKRIAHGTPAPSNMVLS
jgi:hypothetical protein